jgi:hypothetical protein
VVREDPARAGLLYAGTEFGMYVSFDDGGTWQSMQLNLPVTPVTDLKLVDDDLVLSTMGRGFWILYDRTPLFEVTSELASERVHLFAVSDAVRFRTGVGRASEPGPDEPQYPSTGANVDYWLGEPIEGEMRLEILSSDGEILRSFVGDAAEPEADDDEGGGMAAMLARSAGPSTLPRGRGAHRFVWDLRAEGPWHADPRLLVRFGPMVPPGTYTARLTAGGAAAERSFEVVMDPRVVAEGVDGDVVRAQFALASSVQATVTAARRAAARLAVAKEALADGEELGPELAAVDERLNTAPVRYSPPMLLDQLDYLYTNLLRADQLPGGDAIARHEELASELAEIVADLDRLLGVES